MIALSSQQDEGADAEFDEDCARGTRGLLIWAF